MHQNGRARPKNLALPRSSPTRAWCGLAFPPLPTHWCYRVTTIRRKGLAFVAKLWLTVSRADAESYSRDAASDTPRAESRNWFLLRFRNVTSGQWDKILNTCETQGNEGTISDKYDSLQNQTWAYPRAVNTQVQTGYQHLFPLKT